MIGLPLGAVAVLATAAAGALKWRGRSRSKEPETYECLCGQRFRVAGRDRHRVYWLAGAPDDDPLLGTSCPTCGAALPQGTSRDLGVPATALA
jgi:hypothetical protein